jgi:uncharacterized protein (TIGR02588 family)
MAKARTPARRPTATSTRKARSQPAAASKAPLLEWVAAGVGLLLATTAVGFTLWDALFGVDGPPAIEVRLIRVTPTGHGYVAEFDAINHGGEPAAQVQIEGIVSGAGEPDTADVTIDYIPEQSRASGGLIFERDPRAGSLKLRAKGYADPA